MKDNKKWISFKGLMVFHQNVPLAYSNKTIVRIVIAAVYNLQNQTITKIRNSINHLEYNQLKNHQILQLKDKIQKNY